MEYLRKIILSILAPYFLLAGCVSIEVPEGFALLSEKIDNIRAISPEGLRLELRYEKNKLKKDLDFWKKTYMYYMYESGYQEFSDPEDFETPLGTGFYMEWAVPYLGETWIYLNAVVLKDDKIVILETAGQEKVFFQYREDILETLKTIE